MRPGPAPVPLRLYRALAAPLSRLALARADRRLTAAGVPAARLRERRGEATLPRPAGRLVWFHGASVGESLSALPLVARIADRAGILVTTGTATSAALMARRLPDHAVHQFAPVDAPAPVADFLGHWRPDLAVFVESEVWPILLCRTAASGTPLALVNARLSARSLARWQRLPGTARFLFGLFDLVVAQDAATRDGLAAITGTTPLFGGNLKAAVPPPEADPEQVEAWRGKLGGRPVWTASSTHPGEDEAVLDAHEAVLRRRRDALLILVPRHPERGGAVAALARGRSLGAARRSAGEEPGPDCQVYVADTIGETGLWYRIAPLVFLAGSFGAAGGHNPWEPAALGAALLHGPKVPNAAADYAALGAAGAARMVADAHGLADAVIELLADIRRREAMREAARDASGHAEETADALAERLLELMARADAA